MRKEPEGHARLADRMQANSKHGPPLKSARLAGQCLALPPHPTHQLIHPAHPPASYGLSRIRTILFCTGAGVCTSRP